ncbi:class I mannose-6-phosphate isomerase [Sphingopyxis indica]|uniref:class I mannose-6-phosphate isomerase n=1 Tax=Sphingopyxis indica TaxID=436663 RepID=UPI00293922A0|nr:class I mannose-6-phosphate isomerase [Sphingopyxis indica]WOF44571.1 class I mannose-6-phosphate isomerase [Sphingopyxis indica]
MLTRLETRIVEKPWGRCDIPPAFGNLGDRRVGEIWFEDPAGDAAPLMVKFLFTSERLSIQVHPDDDAAQSTGFRRGKDECWLVLDATAEAALGVGLTGESSVAALRDAALDGSIEAMIDWRTPRAGDFIYNPAGTIHAIGPGLIVVEVQQNVDLTYRLYDYGRDRQLHLDAGLAVAKARPHHDKRDTHVADTDNRILVEGPHFHLRHLAGAGARALLPQAPGRYTLVPLSPGCMVGEDEITLGECVLIDQLDALSLDSDARALLCWPE